jgi:hypothetical protein
MRVEKGSWTSNPKYADDHPSQLFAFLCASGSFSVNTNAVVNNGEGALVVAVVVLGVDIEFKVTDGVVVLEAAAEVLVRAPPATPRNLENKLVGCRMRVATLLLVLLPFS